MIVLRIIEVNYLFVDTIILPFFYYIFGKTCNASLKRKIIPTTKSLEFFDQHSALPSHRILCHISQSWKINTLVKYRLACADRGLTGPFLELGKVLMNILHVEIYSSKATGSCMVN